LTCAASVGADGQESIDRSRRNAIVRAIEEAAPAVVSVNVIVEQGFDPFSSNPWFWDFFYRPRRTYQKIDSIGSGFIFTADGYILTNFHVVEGSAQVASVTLPDGREVEVDYVGSDERTDLAVLRAKGKDFPHVPLGDSSDLLTGEWVIAIGNPFGGLMGDAQPTVSVGVISANHRRVSPTVGRGERLYQDMIQTDAAINPGNSGGPLVNAKGDVVGVNTMIFSRSGGSVGLGFAIPINRAKRVAEEIIRHGRRRDPWAGFKVEDVQSLRPNLLRELGIRVEEGCLVVNILRNSPAHEAGLRPGDVITGINDHEVHTSTDIDFVMWDLFVGDTITLEVNREGKTLALSFPVKELSR
jgi:serine protease Do